MRRVSILTVRMMLSRFDRAFSTISFQDNSGECYFAIDIYLVASTFCLRLLHADDLVTAKVIITSRLPRIERIMQSLGMYTTLDE